MKNRENITLDEDSRIEQQVKKVREAKVKLASKMSSKITYLVLLAILIPIALVITLSVRSTTSTLKDIYMSYALNLAEEAVSGIDFAIQLGESTYGNYAMDMAEEIAKGIDQISYYEKEQDYNVLTKLLGNVAIEGVEGSYAYMVSPDGTMLYHPPTDKVGKSVENAAVKGIVEDLAAGKTVE
ncbi:MAG: hypothetical protein J5962_03920, partial [Lachnospiraceae bacterium]|nr:hypothetical protein [Lachnospiraceae bacterium]